MGGGLCDPKEPSPLSPAHLSGSLARTMGDFFLSMLRPLPSPSNDGHLKTFSRVCLVRNDLQELLCLCFPGKYFLEGISGQAKKIHRNSLAIPKYQLHRLYKKVSFFIEQRGETFESFALAYFHFSGPKLPFVVQMRFEAESVCGG